MVDQKNDRPGVDAPIDASDLGARMIRAMEDQTEAIDNHAGSIDDLRDLLESLAKKLKLGSIVSSLLGGKKKT